MGLSLVDGQNSIISWNLWKGLHRTALKRVDLSATKNSCFLDEFIRVLFDIRVDKFLFQ